MDKASDFESEDCEFESRRGRFFSFTIFEITGRIFNVSSSLKMTVFFFYVENTLCNGKKLIIDSID